MRNFAESAFPESSQNLLKIVITDDDRKKLLLRIMEHATGELLAAIFTSQEPMPSPETCRVAGQNIATTAMIMVEGIFECLDGV
jgi:hypothetical protein